MGLFDYEMPGNPFDFNGDGKTTMDETYLAYKIYEESTKDDKSEPMKFDTPLSFDSSYKPVSTDNFNQQNNKNVNYDSPEKTAGITLGCFGAIMIIVIAFAIILNTEERNDLLNAAILFGAVGLSVFVLKATGAMDGESFAQKWKMLTPEEKRERKEKFFKKAGPPLIVITVIAAIIGGGKWYHNYTYGKNYRQAIAYYMDGDYAKAHPIFDSYDEEYKDAEDWQRLCKAWEYYEEDDIFRAHLSAEHIDFTHLNSKQRAFVNSELAIINAAWDDYYKEAMEKKAESKTQSSPTVPYVGMSESRIKSTSLGAPSSTVRHNKQVKNGQVYTANLYDFYRGKQRIFTARCVNGTVTEVWDDRNATTTKYHYTTKKHSTTMHDPYNAKSYSNEDDFYDDNYDDFESYEDAEDYYNEYH